MINMFGNIEKIEPEPENKTVYLIPVANYPDLEKKLTFLNRNISSEIIGSRIRETHKVYEVVLSINIVMVDQWQFAAKVINNEVFQFPNTTHLEFFDYGENGYIIRKGNVYGYIEDISDFFQCDDNEISSMLSNMLLADTLAKSEETYSKDINPFYDRYIPLKEYLAQVFRIVATQGWVSAKDARRLEVEPTAHIAYNSLYSDDGIVSSDEDLTIAEQAIEWAKNINIGSSEYNTNVYRISHKEYISGRDMRTAASIIGVYQDRKRLLPKKYDYKNIISLFDKAFEKLPYPKIKLSIPDFGDVILTRASHRSKYEGAVNISSDGNFDDNIWYGRIERNGYFVSSRNSNSAITRILTILNDEPEKVVAEYGSKTGRCSMCYRKLKDPKSVNVGYGPTCAKNFNLPYR